MKVLTNWALSATAFLFLSLLGYHSAYFPLYPPFCVIFFDSPIEQSEKTQQAWTHIKMAQYTYYT